MPQGRGLFEVARERMRTRHLALRTVQTYLQWMRRYVKFHNRRHPRDMGPAEVEAFLTHLAADAKVGASTQNQALQALLFLYRQVLGMELPWLDNVTRARRAKRLRVVLSAAEVRSVLSHIDGTSWLIASLLYGSGLRLMEAHRLRVKDLLLERGEIIVRDAKGGKDRVTVLPESLVAPLREYLAKLFDRFERHYSVNPLRSLYYTRLKFSELPCPTPNLQILTSSIPSVWCWASSSCSRSFYSALRARLAPMPRAKVYCSTRCI